MPRTCNVVADCLASFGACLNAGNSRLWLDQAAESVMPLVSGELPKPVNMELCFHLKKCFKKNQTMNLSPKPLAVSLKKKTKHVNKSAV